MSAPYNETFTAFVTAAPAASTPADTDFFAIIQGGLTKRVSLQVVRGAFTEQTVAVDQIVTSGSIRTAYVTSAAPINFTLPQTASAGISKEFSISVFAEAGTATLTPNAADSINGQSAGASLSLPKGSWAVLVTDGAGNWYAQISLGTSNAVPWAVAAGTVDAITAAYLPVNKALTDGLLLSFRASGANLTTAPTFSPDGLTAHAITKDGGLPLVAGDIPAAGAEVMVRYNLANTRWEIVGPILNSVPWAVAAGTADAIAATFSPAVVVLTDGLLLSFRASAPNATTAPTFSPNGLTAHTITKEGGAALIAGDIPAALAECVVRYNLANTRWELLNPAGYAPGILPVHLVTAGASYNVQAGDVCIGVNKTIGSATSIVVPATGTLGQYLEIADVKGDAGANAITLSGSTFDGASATIVISLNFQVVSLRWYGTYWKQI